MYCSPSYYRQSCTTQPSHIADEQNRSSCVFPIRRYIFQPIMHKRNLKSSHSSYIMYIFCFLVENSVHQIHTSTSKLCLRETYKISVHEESHGVRWCSWQRYLAMTFLPAVSPPVLRCGCVSCTVLGASPSPSQIHHIIRKTNIRDRYRWDEYIEGARVSKT